MSKIYSLSQAIKITDVPQPRLQTWLREGYIVPSVIGEGSGSRNGYDFKTLCQIKLLDHLVKNGMQRAAAVIHIQQLPSSDKLENDQQETSFIVASGGLKARKTNVTGFSTKSSGNYTDIQLRIAHDPDTLPDEWTDIITIYCLKRIVSEVKRGIERLK